MGMSDLTFYNIKTIEVTPEHFEHTDYKQNMKALELIFTAEDNSIHRIVIFGNLMGANTLPEMINKPAKVIKLP